MPYPRLILFCISMLFLAAQAGSSPLFDENSVIDVELRGPIDSLLKNKKDENELPFVFSANGIEHQVQIRARGNSRLRVCDFPPLRLNFSTSDTEQTLFAGQDELKLVSHCKSRDASQVDALQEYAAYRIFNLLTDVSYRVRLLRISYIDTEKKEQGEVLQRFGFVIESQLELAERLGGRPANVSGVSLRSVDETHAAIVYVFQYLIGNTDWSLARAEDDDVCCHNGDIVDLASRYFYVPYDFDLAGLVDASYAYPDPSLPIREVTQRMYRGYCTSRESLENAIGRVKSRKTEILDSISRIPGIPEKEQAEGIEFLTHFFARADDADRLLRTFERHCL